MGLPWRDEREAIPSEFQLCFNRLRSLHKKLRKDPPLLKEYDEIINGQSRMKIIEEVPLAESSNKFSEDVHYLQHDAVLRQN